MNEAPDGVPYHHGDLRRTLVSAAVALLTETQDWGFSLREVARRAGVSHAAPYNHFSSKQDLLMEVAAAGFDLLRLRMQEAAAPARTPSAALHVIGAAYVRFGVENPAHYRLMFGTALMAGTAGKGCLPGTASRLGESAAAAKGVLHGIIEQGAQEGSFAVAPRSAEAVDIAVLSAWSLVHGLTMLLIDGLAGAGSVVGEETTVPIHNASAATAAEGVVEQVTGVLLNGMCAPQKAQKAQHP